MRKCSVYVDEETKDRLKALAEQEGRSIINMLRVMVNGYVDGQLNSLPGLDRTVLIHVGRDEGLDSLAEAMSFVIQDWVHMKAQAVGVSALQELGEEGSDEQ